MANPQIKDGYIRIATGIWEALMKIRIPGEARQILDTIIRKTYGFQKKEDRISLSQFANSTGIKRPHIIRAVYKLINMRLITKKGTSRYGFNKDFDYWRALPKKVTITIKGNKVAKKGNRLLPKKVHTIDTITIDTNTKDNIHSKGHPDDAKTPLLKVLKAYRLKKFPEILELEETAKIEEIRAWNKHNIPKWSKYAKELLEYLGSWQMAVSCIDELGDEFNKNPNIADWTLAAISKNASRWKLQQREKNDEHRS